MAVEPVTPELKWFLFEGLRSLSGSDSLWFSLSDQQFYLPPAGEDLWCYGQQTSSHIQLQRGLETGRLLLWSLWPFNIPSHANCSRGWDMLLLIIFYIHAGCSVIILLYLNHSAIETFQWCEILFLSVLSLQNGISWIPFLLANNVLRRKRSCYAFFMKIS